MNLQMLKQNKHNFLVLITILFFTGCWDFLSVDQPDIADPNSFFDVPITISLTAEPDSGRGYFGILLPVGWIANDSITYSGVHNGTFIYSSSASDTMANFNCAPSGYYWWMCEVDSVDSLLEGTISLTPRIYTDYQSGSFFVEYMISNSVGPPGGYWHISSGKFPVSVNAPMTVTVTNTNDNGSGSLRQALSDVSSSGEIIFNLLSYPDTIQLDSQLVIDRNLTISGPASGNLNIFGTDSARVIWINENLNLVKISNLNISFGNVDGGGGGIYCVGSNLIINNVSIKNNFASNSGGGI
jgi:hypothetical protein